MVDPAVKHLVDVLIQDQHERYSGGVERFLTALALEGGRKGHEEWAALPETRLFLDLLKSLADTVPLHNTSDLGGMAKALGCMSGINLVIRLIEDPTRVFPGIYDGAGNIMSRAGRKEDIGETYVAPPENETPEKE